ncbi:MAG TPA: peptidoglycan DD-metalloendopeptidase family protein [Gammaproteobacteria bacterium]
MPSRATSLHTQRFVEFATAALILSFCGWPAAGDQPANADRLERLRGRIREVQAGLSAARDESDALLIELQEAEAAAAASAAALADIEAKLDRRRARLQELTSERETQSSILSREREQLGAQVRATYRSGRNDFIKLLLNQEDPALVGRTLAYHDQFNRARAANIGRIGAVVARLETLERGIAEETSGLEALRSLEVARVEDLKARRESRAEVMARLQEHIAARDRELQMLKRNERDLVNLLDRLGEETTLVESFEKLPPFTALRGNLKWPVKGEIAERFGAPRKGGRLRAQGVTISAPAGSDVRAVSAGMVIFADWFRNLGLLIIVDHGEGYMSLYGHNEALEKKAGDMVAVDEVISRVGDTGGQSETTLYFEIRENGAPVDPALWCRG